MSAAELKCDDSEPPSRSCHRFTVSISIDSAVESTAVPPHEQLNAWIEHTILGLPTLDKQATHFEVSVSVVDDVAIQALNLEYRSKDKPTNVLSFPSGMPTMAAEADELSFRALGDVVMCQSVIAQEAHEQNKPLEHHYAHMLVHSVLHLFEYDHESDADAKTMEALEVQLLNELSIPNPYQLSFQNQ